MRFLSAVAAAAILSASVAPALADTMTKASPKPAAHSMKSDHMKGSSMKSQHAMSGHAMSGHPMAGHMMKASPKPTSKP